MNNHIQYLIDLLLLVVTFTVVELTHCIDYSIKYYIPDFMIISLQGFHDWSISIFQIIAAAALCAAAIYRFYKEVKKK